MNRVVLIIGAVILVLALGFFVLSKQASNPAQEYDLTTDTKEELALGETTDAIAESQVQNNTQEAPVPTVMTSASQKKYSSRPEMTIDGKKSYTATLITSEGTIKMDLFAQKTPFTVNNFVFLARDGFYEDTIFHRVMKDFMIQGGDPEGTGRGGPGYTFDDEPFDGSYERGTVAMANAGPDTNGSQFFIMHDDFALPKNYVIFGKVTEGMDVVDKIAEANVVESDSGERSKPAEPVKIFTVKIDEN